jgi:hypothetical protein
MANFEENVIEERKQYFLVDDLRSKYGIEKSSFYGKLDALGIVQFKKRGKAYITPEDLQLLDDLDIYLKEKKGSTNDFVQECIESGRIDASSIKSKKTRRSTSSAEAELPPMQESSEIVLAPQPPETVVASQLPLSENSEELRFAVPPLSTIEQLDAQKQVRISQEDLAEADERSQYRAATKVVAEDVLTQMYEITEEFTVPGLKEQVEEHRRKLKQSRSNQRFIDAGNDFLSQMFQSQMPPPGTTGSTKSANLSNNPLTTSNTAIANS